MPRTERSDFIRVRVTKQEKASLEHKASQSGMTISDHLRELIKGDLKEKSPADTLSIDHFELTIQIGLMLANLIDKEFGSIEGGNLREQTQQRARDMCSRFLINAGLKRG